MLGVDAVQSSGRIRGRNTVKRVSHWSAFNFPWLLSPRFLGGRAIHVGITASERHSRIFESDSSPKLHWEATPSRSSSSSLESSSGSKSPSSLISSH